MAVETLPTVSEILKVIEKTRGKRLRLFLRWFLTAGTRVSAALNLKWTDLKEDTDGFTIRISGKGGKERRIRQPYKNLVREIREAFDGLTYLFETVNGKQYRREYVSHEIERAIERVTGKRCTVHGLRHVFATTAIRGGWDAKKLQTHLGHSTTSTTLDMYVHSKATAGDVRRLFWRQRSINGTNGIRPRISSYRPSSCLTPQEPDGTKDAKPNDPHLWGTPWPKKV